MCVPKLVSSSVPGKNSVVLKLSWVNQLKLNFISIVHEIGKIIICLFLQVSQVFPFKLKIYVGKDH